MKNYLSHQPSSHLWSSHLAAINPIAQFNPGPQTTITFFIDGEM